MNSFHSRCCIVGGGPAGVMLGYLLARAGVPVTVLEKHADFLRDFRGDTVHPSTMQVLAEVALLEKFERLPQRRVSHLSVRIGGRVQEVIDFRGLEPFPYLSLVPQWDFLDFLASEAAQRYPEFDLRMRHEAVDLEQENGRVIGVRVHAPEGEIEIDADLVVACDGRHSTVRDAARLSPHNLGAPMDVLWFRLPRAQTDPEDTFGMIGNGHMMVLLNRTDYWQIGYLVPKGGERSLRAKPIEAFRIAVAEFAEFLAERTPALESWDQIRTLEVRVDRLEQWHAPGLLLIGDAAHAMSPIGGVGINLAIQDAVCAANCLAEKLRTGTVIDDRSLHAVQKRRLLPTRFVQTVQLEIQKRVISHVLAQSGHAPEIPRVLQWLLRFRSVRNLPARLFGYGIRREHVHTAEHAC